MNTAVIPKILFDEKRKIRLRLRLAGTFATVV